MRSASVLSAVPTLRTSGGPSAAARASRSPRARRFETASRSASGTSISRAMRAARSRPKPRRATAIVPRSSQDRPTPSVSSASET